MHEQCHVAGNVSLRWTCLAYSQGMEQEVPGQEAEQWCCLASDGSINKNAIQPAGAEDSILEVNGISGSW